MGVRVRDFILQHPLDLFRFGLHLRVAMKVWIRLKPFAARKLLHDHVYPRLAKPIRIVQFQTML